MSYTPFDHPILSGLFGDDETAACFTAQADIEAMLAFEAALAHAQAAHGIIPVQAAEEICRACKSLTVDYAALRAALGKDGVVVPELVRQLRRSVAPDMAPHVHVGATSQDVIDSALMLRLKRVSGLLIARLSLLIAAFDRLDETFGPASLMGYTRMQAAIPITVADRLSSWREPLKRDLTQWENFRDDGFALQFGGAAGTLEKLGSKGPAVRSAMAAELQLTDTRQWQSVRNRIAEFASILSLTSGNLGKFGQDIALMAQSGTEISLSGGGGSSAMAHKQNPVAAETLVALARFNAVQLSGIHHALVHEQERSGAAWMLEWLVLPQMVATTASSIRLSLQLTANIQSMGDQG